MSVAVQTEQILGLARSRAPADRDRLLLAVVDLANAEDAATALAAPQVQSLLSSIFMELVVEAEHDIRRRLAEKLAPAAWAPAELVRMLALDDIEIAAPIIAKSPILQDHDLVRLLVEATVEHQIEVARRARIGAPVIAAILQKGEPAVLTALAGNTAAELSAFDMAHLVETSRRLTALRAPLARRRELTAALARQLYAWVGDTLRHTLAERFHLEAIELERDFADAVQEAHSGAPAPSRAASDADRAEMERRLIAKLLAAGQLNPDYLMRALREQRISLFEAALAALGGFTPDQIQRALDSAKPELLALACASIGVDRSAFPTILRLVRQLNAGRPGGGAEGGERALGAFGPFTPEAAAAAFRQAVGAV